jgi:hypothetical protein
MKNAASVFTLYQSAFFAHRITLEGVGDDALAQSLSTARVDMNPHQVDAALFALGSPLSKGVILADEVGLGKTIEASLVIAQRWAERRRRILLIVPASLRKQWSQELFDKFSLPSIIIESKSYNLAKKNGDARPFDQSDTIVITSYEFAATKADDIAQGRWDLVVYDEAHRLRNVYKQGTGLRAKRLRDATSSFFKILLTATPLQNSLMELYGLVSVIDEHFFGDESGFRSSYVGGGSANNGFLFLRKRLAVLADADPVVEKWLKPGRAQFQIEYRSGDNYEPDFVIETSDRMLIAEIKASNELTDVVVHAKARAATKWCKAATQHAAETGGKPWSYALIGDDQILGSTTLGGLMARFTQG